MKNLKYLWLILGLFLIPFLTIDTLYGAPLVIDEIKVPSLTVGGDAKILVHVPENATAMAGAQGELPVMFIMSGFQTSSGLMDKIASSIGNNILIIFSYPLDDKTNWLDWAASDQQSVQQFPLVSLQALAVLQWLSGPQLQQKYGVKADLHRISTMAISLGVFFLPNAVYMAQSQNIEISSVILAYCGAKLDLVVDQQIKESPESFLADFLAPAMKVLVAPYEPLNLVSQIKSDFLILNALEDQIFPKESQEALVNAIATDKRTVIDVPGNHIGLQQDVRIAMTFELVKNWLVQHMKLNL